MDTDLVTLDDAEFKSITAMLYERFGIYLGDQKRTLVSGRLSKRLRALGLETFTDYLEYLSADRTGSELAEMINRITTNHSFFFRERDHFEFLERTVLADVDRRIAETARYPLRIWSAGCASGEEIYSIAMLLRDHYRERLDGIDLGLLATDISLAALDQARRGEYAGSKLDELSRTLRDAYFRKTAEDAYAIDDRLKAMVLFKRLNLMSENYPLKGQFDAIFCRNVMIYFDRESRNKVVNALFRYVKPGGYFFIGHSESLRGESCPFEYVKPAVYRKGAA
jgi:chemotaxis protein methyltransferase CheR